MAKFYFSEIDSGFITPIHSSWTHNPRGYGSSKQSGKLQNLPEGSLSLQTHIDKIATKQYVLLGQYISNPLEGGSVDLGIILSYIGCMESNTSMNASPASSIRIVSSNGTIVRCFLNYFSSTTVYEYGTNSNYYSRNHIYGIMGVFDAQTGDRIVVEIGTFINNTSTTQYTSSMYVGSNSLYGDIQTSSTSTGINMNPWVDFTEPNWHIDTNPSTPPTITIINYTKSKISGISGKDVCVVTFTADQNLTQWEARADGFGVGQGDLVGSGDALLEGQEAVFEVENEELIWGDKTYRINVYGKNEQGEWSLYG